MAADQEDFIRWPCGTVCTRGELPEFTHMSDDYEVISYMSPEWIELNDSLG